MSIFSQELLFSDKQAVTATAVSDNVIDLGKKSVIPSTGTQMQGDAGAGNDIPVAIHVVEDFAGNTDLQVVFQTSDTVDATGALTNAKDIAQTVAVPVADLKAGYRFNLSEIPEQTTGRYIGLNYVVGGTATAGKIMAGVTAGNAEG